MGPRRRDVEIPPQGQSNDSLLRRLIAVLKGNRLDILAIPVNCLLVLLLERYPVIVDTAGEREKGLELVHGDWIDYV